MLVERIIQFVGDPANHRPHGGQPFALHQLLLKLLFGCDIAHRNDHTGEFGICIEELAGRGPHGLSAPVAPARPIFSRSKTLSPVTTS